MSNHAHRALTIGALLVACVSIFHLACAVVGPAAYRALGAGEEMVTAAAGGALWPAALTVGLALMFGVFCVYGLSAAGRVRRLPLTRTVVVFSGVLFGLRGLGVIRDVAGIVRVRDAVALRNLFYSGAALVIALLYLVGVARGWRRGGSVGGAVG